MEILALTLQIILDIINESPVIMPAFVILNITLNGPLFLNNSPLSYIDIYFEQVVLKSDEQLFNVNNFYPILPGQYIIFEFSIIIVKKYSSYFMGQLGFGPDRTDALLNIVETRVLPSDPNNSNIFLAI
ncbi:43077_t:CDS:2, partial [Gigaspora margarita]